MDRWFALKATFSPIKRYINKTHTPKIPSQSSKCFNFSGNTTTNKFTSRDGIKHRRGLKPQERIHQSSTKIRSIRRNGSAAPQSN